MLILKENMFLANLKRQLTLKFEKNVNFGQAWKEGLEGSS